MTTPFFNDPDPLIQEIFSDQPRLAFFGELGQADLPESQESFFRSRTGDFLQRLQQAVGEQLAAGGLPTLTPQEFFGGLDFQQEARRFSPSQRGLGISGFNPRTRFLFR